MDKNDEEYKLKTTRIFKLAAVINILINLDGGAVPASLNEIIATFNLSSVSTGLVGALVYLGIATGSVLVSPVLGCVSPLRATQGTLVLNTCATLLFGASAGQGMLLTVRFFIGVLQAIPMVYFPVWVDEFGPDDARTVWMAVIQAGAPLGIMSGYVFAGFMTASMEGNPSVAWRISFFVQSGALAFLSFLSFVIIPPELFNVGESPNATKAPGSPRVRMSQAYRSRIESQASADGSVGSAHSVTPRSFSPRMSMDPGGARMSMTPRVSVVCTPMDLFRPSICAPPGAWSPASHGGSVGARPPSMDSNAPPTPSSSTPPPGSAGPTLKEKYPVLQLLSSPIYMACVCTLTALFFVVTGIQFWVTEYMTDVIGQDKSVVVPTFGITSITAPLLGVFLGGCITDKLGGYRGDVEMARTLKVCFVTACFATLSAICASFIPAQLVDINDPTPAFVTLTGFIALTLFFGGGLIPSATGILVIAVSVELRELSSAGSMFFFQLFGYALSPLVSSIVMQVATFPLSYVNERWRNTDPVSYDFAYNDNGLGPNQTAIDIGVELYTKKLKLETGFTVCMLWAFFGVLAMFWAWRAAEAVVRRNKLARSGSGDIPMLRGESAMSGINSSAS